ncbi:MAG: hypothetical protein PUE80_00340 [bacterium]|nr:hypothetical protein [bacterium]
MIKRLFLLFSLIGTVVPTLFAGKWDGAYRAVAVVAQHPEEAISVVDFLISLFLMCIPISIIAGIVSLILKAVFDLDKDDTQTAFLVVGGILLAISLLIYFVVL